MADIDYGEDAGPVTGGSALEELQKLAETFATKIAASEAAEAELKLAKADLTRYATTVLPEAFQMAKMKSFTLLNGATVSLSDILEANLPSSSKIADADEDEKPELIARRIEGLAWLRANGGSPIIKNVMEIDIPKGKDNVVAQLKQLCDELQLSYEQGESVHAGTLKAFLKEKLKLPDVKVPFTTFAIFSGKKAKLKKPKAPKSNEPLI